MKNIIIIVLMLLLPSLAMAQGQVTRKPVPNPVKPTAKPKPKPKINSMTASKQEENKVFDVVEQMPSFPGGQGALMQWPASNMKYPVIAVENGVQGRVLVQFVVEKDGKVTDVHVVKSVDPSLDKEAVRVVAAMPKWIPGKLNGSAVRVKYTVPVTFKL